MPPPADLPPLVIDEEKTLDQVIIDYLASEAESEHLELSLLNSDGVLRRHGGRAARGGEEEPLAESDRRRRD